VSDFSKYVAGQLRKKEEDKRRADAKSLQDKQVLDKGIANLWDSLREQIKTVCKDIAEESGVNVHLHCDDRNEERIVVRNPVSGTFIIGSLSGSHFMFKGDKGQPQYENIFTVKLANNGLDCFLTDTQDRPFLSVEQAAHKIISALLEIPFPP
jgi:hypothetical protein